MGSFFQVPERLSNILLAVPELYLWHYLRHNNFFEAIESGGRMGGGATKRRETSNLARNTLQRSAFTPSNGPHAHLPILQAPPPLHTVLRPNLMSSEEPLWRDRPYTISTK
jgi:hypothetical protein